MLPGRAHAVSPAMDRARSGRWFFCDGLQPIAEGSGTDDRTTYTVAPSPIGGIICRKCGIGILPMNTGGTPVPHWYHFDRLGNVVAVTDENGDVVRVYDNTAFSYFFIAYEGDGYDNNVSDVQPYHLTTKEWDADTGLYYFNARWYDKNTGRFVSPDLVEEKSSTSQYAYCSANPIGCADPTGNTETDGAPDFPIYNPSDLPPGTSCGPWRKMVGIEPFVLMSYLDYEYRFAPGSIWEFDYWTYTKGRFGKVFGHCHFTHLQQRRSVSWQRVAVAYERDCGVTCLFHLSGTWPVLHFEQVKIDAEDTPKQYGPKWEDHKTITFTAAGTPTGPLSGVTCSRPYPPGGTYTHVGPAKRPGYR